jgi:hypothetical protein
VLGGDSHSSEVAARRQSTLSGVARDYGLRQVESREVRDTIIDSGMETGPQEGMDILEQVARELA